MEMKRISSEQTAKQNRTILMAFVMLALFLNAGSFEKYYTFEATTPEVILWICATWVACMLLALTLGCMNCIRVSRHNKLV